MQCTENNLGLLIILFSLGIDRETHNWSFRWGYSTFWMFRQDWKISFGEYMSVHVIECCELGQGQDI